MIVIGDVSPQCLTSKKSAHSNDTPMAAIDNPAESRGQARTNTIIMMNAASGSSVVSRAAITVGSVIASVVISSRVFYFRIGL